MNLNPQNTKKNIKNNIVLTRVTKRKIAVLYKDVLWNLYPLSSVVERRLYGETRTGNARDFLVLVALLSVKDELPLWEASRKALNILTKRMSKKMKELYIKGLVENLRRIGVKDCSTLKTEIARVQKEVFGLMDELARPKRRADALILLSLLADDAEVIIELNK